MKARYSRGENFNISVIKLEYKITEKYIFVLEKKFRGNAYEHITLM